MITYSYRLFVDFPKHISTAYLTGLKVKEKYLSP